MGASTCQARAVRRALATMAMGYFLASATFAEVDYPAGKQDFEAMAVGDAVQTIGWEVVNTSSPLSLFTVEAQDDVLGSVTPRGTSTRWLRITDSDAANVQNRFYSPPIAAPQVEQYEWTFYVNLETTPPGGANTKPKITVQHFDNSTSLFGNAWGIEFTSTGANLIVLGIGGTAASTALYPLAPPTGIGSWVKVRLRVDFRFDTVSASANDGPAVTLPISLVGTGDENLFRLCYRGEGTGNSVTMLLDDPSVAVIPGVPAVGEWGVLILSLLVLSAGSVVLLQYRRTA